jgi:outer membrane autotransporter protein
VTTQTIQTKNIGLRLTALRHGIQGISVSGLSLVGDQDAPSALAASVPGSSGYASAAVAARGPGSDLGVFLNGQGSFGEQDATSREAGADFHTIGVTTGADFRLTRQVVLGGALGYLASKSELDTGSFNGKGVSLSAFGTYYLGDEFYIDAIASYGWTWYETERRTDDGVARGDPDGTQIAVSVSVGHDLSFGALSIGPYGRVDYTHIEIDGFNERGAGPANVRVSSQDLTSLLTTVGGHASYAIRTQWGVFSPTVSAEWQHEFEDNARIVKASVIGGPTFESRTNNPDRDYFTLGGGLVATFRGGRSAFIHYESILGRDNFTYHGLTAGLRLEF